MPSISAVIPAYNEALIIASTAEAVDDVAVAPGRRLRGHRRQRRQPRRDPTHRRGAAAAAADRRLVSHAVNRGYGAALATGFAAATREYIFLTDGDRQFDVPRAGGIPAAAGPADIVVGYRRPRADPWVSALLRLGLEHAGEHLFGYTARDVDCAFKLFPRALLQDVHLHSTGHTLSPELLIKARRAGYRIAEVRVTHLPRTTGEAKGARIDHIVRSLLELVRLRLEVARTLKTAPSPSRCAARISASPTSSPVRGRGE